MCAVLSDCPKNLRIDPPSSCQAYKKLTIYADSYPPASYYWIDHMNGDQRIDSQTFTLQPGPYNLTAVAVSNISCSMDNPVCRDPGSYAEQSSDPDFPFNLFGFTATNSHSSESCEANVMISGLAVGE